jgi:rod shape-determining protein MreC
MRTGYLDTITERSGLEIVEHVLSPLTWIRNGVVSVWERYFALVDVAAENTRLRRELSRAEAAATLAAEERAEITRLRELLQIKALEDLPGFGARVIARRFGPQSVFKTLTVNKGFTDGAIAGTPVISGSGVVGRVLRAAPSAATVLLLTDPGFRLAVISQKSRTLGIAVGTPQSQHQLEVTYVPQTASLEEGELLVTAGVDGVFPKGIPVGVVTKITPGAETLFPTVQARPAADLDRLEEVVLLLRQEDGPPLIRREEPSPGPSSSESASPGRRTAGAM